MSAVEIVLRNEPAIVAEIVAAHHRLVSLGLGDTGWSLVRLSADAALGASELLIADLASLNARGLSVAASAAVLAGEISVTSVETALRAMWEATEHNPMPEFEWAPLRVVMTDELLAEPLGVSLQSIRRYAAGERDTPDDVAARLHFIALVNADLGGSYNERGIRRWWNRPRSTLGNRSPLSVLGAGFDPDSDVAAQVRSLSSALLGAGAVS